MVIRFRCSSNMEKVRMDSSFGKDDCTTTREVSRTFAEGQMNREDIIRMAKEAGFDYSSAELSWESVICTEELERFAALVASAEREACAKQLDALGCDHCATAIRAREQA